MYSTQRSDAYKKIYVHISTMTKNLVACVAAQFMLAIARHAGKANKCRKKCCYGYIVGKVAHNADIYIFFTFMFGTHLQYLNERDLGDKNRSEYCTFNKIRGY